MNELVLGLKREVSAVRRRPLWLTKDFHFCLESTLSSDDGDKMVITIYKEHKKAIKCNNVASKRLMLEKDVHLGI